MITPVLKTNSVYTFKLNSGEEVIAKVVSNGNNWLHIENPVSVAPGPQGLGLVPSMFTSDLDEPIYINTDSVTLYAVTDEAVKNKYIEAVTGIRLPEKKLILG
jgi:hypothetical protein